jgi:hypothetical protein
MRIEDMLICWDISFFSRNHHGACCSNRKPYNFFFEESQGCKPYNWRNNVCQVSKNFYLIIIIIIIVVIIIRIILKKHDENFNSSIYILWILCDCYALAAKSLQQWLMHIRNGNINKKVHNISSDNYFIHAYHQAKRQ